MKKVELLVTARLTDCFPNEDKLIMYFRENPKDESYNKFYIPLTRENEEITEKISDAFSKKVPVILNAIYKHNPNRITEFFLIELPLLSFTPDGKLESYEYKGKLFINNESYQIDVISRLGGLRYESKIRKLENFLPITFN